MLRKPVTIDMKEYERLLRMEDLSHRQRIRIRNLECELEKYKARVSVFSNKTLQILLGSGYRFNEVMLLYGGKDVYVK